MTYLNNSSGPPPPPPPLCLSYPYLINPLKHIILLFLTTCAEVYNMMKKNYGYTLALESKLFNVVTDRYFTNNKQPLSKV